MAKIDVQEITVGRVYARSMLELAGAEGDDATEDLLDELRALVALTESDSDLEHFLSSPMVGLDARRDVLEKVFRGSSSDLFVDSLQVLNRNSRLAMLPAIAEALRLEYDALRDIVDVEVRSAVELSEELRERLREKVRALTRKSPQLSETIDPSIQGGLIVQIGDDRLDGSVATQLHEAGAKLKARAARELRSEKSYWN